MATINPLVNKPLGRSNTTALHNLGGGVIGDENKIPAKVSALDKAKSGVTLKSRGALSEITNNTISGVVGKSGKSMIAPSAVLPQQSNIVPRIVSTRAKSELGNLRNQQPTKLQKLENSAIPTHMPSEHMIDTDQDKDAMIDDVHMVEAEQPENIDIFDAHDPQCVGEYVNDIFAYYRDKEIADRIDGDYIHGQQLINEKMRAILIDWMMAVHVRFKMISETFFLSVNIVDRYLSKVSIPVGKLQLVGITSMLLAAKYEEIYSPQINDFIVTSDNACTREEVLLMERNILSALQFHLTTTTPLHFLRRFSKAAGSDSRTHSLSKYLTELCMLDSKLLKYLPSMIAAACIYVARRMTNRCGPYWNVTLEYYTCYKESDVIACAHEINLLRKGEDHTTLRATKKKYLSPKLMEVAAIPPVDL
ncbi:cyclin [Cavenderia fasciculata]|uniref:Cyclin n=1 Tax=Cavenderia fasciculata TaxID=261658 RepID=F4PR69_CACFS|nr:cyclin [Cavenderia fasciculata]EGG21269.1 cyclin [Cavenderia fasciculata]|eukprot:XP_004359119.1 cyclin [Cavenderia fasciculata]